MNLEEMSREELIEELRHQLLERDHQLEVHEKVVQHLREHQVELELQNRLLTQSQKALEVTKRRFEDHYDLAPVAYLTFDREGIVQEVNLAGAHMFGLDRAQLVGRAFSSLVEMPSAAAFFAHLHACERKQQPVVTELRFSVGGRDYEVQAITVPVVDPAGAVTAFRTSLADITRLKRTEVALERARRNEQQIRVRFERLDRAVLELGEILARFDGRPEGVTEVLERIVEHARTITNAQYGAVGVDGDTDRAFELWVQRGVDPELAAAIGRTPRARGLLGEVLRTGRSMRVRDLRTHPTFTGFPPHHPEMRSFLGVPIPFGGQVIGHLYLANKRDVDEFSEDDQVSVEMLAVRAGVVLQITTLSRELRAAVEARENVLAIVSHDLRGPLSTLTLSAELARRIGVEGTELRRSLDMILRSASRMTELIDDLLQAATIEAGRFTITTEVRTVASILEPAIEMFEARAVDRAIYLERQIPVDLPAVRCDEHRLVQVLANLIGNALKFVSAGGHVRVRAWAEAGEVRIAVADDGPGIPLDQIPHLFERFWKGHAESRRGTGLGLFIAKGIVEAHRGRIWVDSRLGEGTTFTFAIPIASEPLLPRPVVEIVAAPDK